MKYILLNGSSYYDLNLNKVANTDTNIKAVIDAYGFDMASITNFSYLSDFRIVGLKLSNGVDPQATLTLNNNYSYILINYDFSGEDNIKFDSYYKFLLSKDKVNWFNFINETEYLEYKFDLNNLSNIDDSKFEILEYVRKETKYLDKVKNFDFKYLILKIDTEITNIKIQCEVGSDWVIKVNNIQATIDNGQLNITNSLTVNNAVDMTVFKLGCDNVIDTIKEF